MGFLNGNGRENDKTGGVPNGATKMEAVPDPSTMKDLVGDDATEMSTEDELEKVRQLLFGVQMKKLREDMGRFDDRFSEQSVEVKDLMARRLDAFERSIQTRIDKIEQRLSQESNQRLDAYNQIVSKLDTHKEMVEGGLEKLGSRVDEGQSQLTSQLHGQGKLFAESIRRNCQELSAHFEREAEAAAKARADRSAVAHLMLELSKQLDRSDMDEDA